MVAVHLPPGTPPPRRIIRVRMPVAVPALPFHDPPAPLQRCIPQRVGGRIVDTAVLPGARRPPVNDQRTVVVHTDQVEIVFHGDLSYDHRAAWYITGMNDVGSVSGDRVDLGRRLPATETEFSGTWRIQWYSRNGTDAPDRPQGRHDFPDEADARTYLGSEEVTTRISLYWRAELQYQPDWRTVDPGTGYGTTEL